MQCFRSYQLTMCVACVSVSVQIACSWLTVCHVYCLSSLIIHTLTPTHRMQRCSISTSSQTRATQVHSRGDSSWTIHRSAEKAKGRYWLKCATSVFDNSQTTNNVWWQTVATQEPSDAHSLTLKKRRRKHTRGPACSFFCINIYMVTKFYSLWSSRSFDLHGVIATRARMDRIPKKTQNFVDRQEYVCKT